MSTPTVSKIRGTGYDMINTQNKNPQQMAWANQVQQALGPGTVSALQGLSGIASGDQSYFDQLEAPAMRQFGQLQSQIASRFSGMGTNGARHSSGFQNAQTGAATDFAERLQAQRLGLQQNAWQQLLGMGQHLYDSDTFDSHFLPKKKSFWEELFGSLSGGIGQGLGTIGGVYGASKMGLF